MQSKYKSPGSRTLLVLCTVIGVAICLFGEGPLRLAALLAAAIFGLLLYRKGVSQDKHCAFIAAAGAAMLATGNPIALVWIWILPLTLLSFTGPLGLAINVAGFVVACAYLGWQLPLPTAAMAALMLAILWLLFSERLRGRASTSPPTEATWLLPPAALEVDIHHELRRGERESLAAEVLVFGCAQSTPEDMTQLCARLHEYLALYERAYRLNAHGVAVIVVATDSDAAAERRRELEHAVQPHKVVSAMPLAEATQRFGQRKPTSTPAAEAPLWQ
ncbi:hypothetical protein [Salinicola aestuarinus]|uniref:hypothetical protein n=1 Tax=Salinicola aestuarinus TaxID=1949082 RepID=UPI000DA12DF9|nr:hypothetical protein [Salinicola aestuarinus]